MVRKRYSQSTNKKPAAKAAGLLGKMEGCKIAEVGFAAEGNPGGVGEGQAGLD